MRYSIQVTRRQYAKTPLILRSLGIDHSQEPILRSKGFPIWQLFYGLDGLGEFRYEGGRGILRPGQLALLYPREGHSYQSLGGEWTLHYVGFDGSVCPKLLSTLGLSRSGIYRPGDQALVLTHLFALRDIAAAEGQQRLTRGSKELYALLLDLAESLVRLPDSDTGRENSLEREMILYLEDHFREDISLDTLAGRFRRTPEYLCSLFKAATGDTVMQYLRRIRIHQAKLLLMERPDSSLREICDACGFHSVSYFGKVFREATGFTPQTYRLGAAWRDPSEDRLH